MLQLQHGSARCMIWWADPPEPGVGRIGAYEAETQADGVAVLLDAAEQLRARGCTQIVGPMDGSTWHAYRFVTDLTGDAETERPAFAMEPWQPAVYPQHWEAAGFAPVAEYVSAFAPDPSRRDPRRAALEQRAADAGLRLAPMEDVEGALAFIYRVSLASFAENYLYAPISETEFRRLYEPALPLIDPRLVLLAHGPDGPAGFAFGLPDVAQAQRGEPIDTFIVKTVAVMPAARGLGLGSLLTDRLHEAGTSIGYTSAIHALMHAGNASRKISEKSAHVFRRYHLYGVET
ncbi:MAG: N-acetyltransferase [Bacteroidota bacterium]